MNKGCFFILVFLLLAVSCTKTKLNTPLEKSNYQKLSMNSEIIKFLDEASNNTFIISYKIIDTTAEGRFMTLVKISVPDVTQKQCVFLIAQQHGNEPSGKEGLLLLIQDFAKGKNTEWLNNFDLYIIPQVNPDGGDLNQRRTAEGFDLNRDHLLLKSTEAKTVQDIFDELKPIVTVDFHEYGPYQKSWKEFGYQKNFDIQFGGLTNINVDGQIRSYFYSTIFNQVEKYVENNSYSFFEYTLGNFALGERLRHSTVDINDGRQSFGICNTMSFIVEGKNGRDSIENIKNRAFSQYETAKGILNSVYENFSEINAIVNNARLKNYKADSSEKVSIRMDHFKRKETLQYPLLSLKTGKDTIFNVEEYHSEVKSLLGVKVPESYLIPKSDTVLCNWLQRSNFTYTDYNLNESDRIFAYKIVDLTKSIDEGLENYYPSLEKEKVQKSGLTDKYYQVNTNQFYKYKIVTALEPQAMYGLVNYPEFEYLLKNNYFKILRIEY